MRFVLCIVLIIASIVSLQLTGYFFVNRKDAGQVRYYLLWMGIASFLWTFNYGVIGLCTDVQTVLVLRAIGIIGVNIFALAEFFLATNFSGITKRAKWILRAFVGFFAIIDVGIFTAPETDLVIVENGMTVLWPVACIGRSYHTIYVLGITLLMIANGVLWGTRVKSKREMQFVKYIFCANFTLVFCMIPDTFLTMMNQKVIPMSGLGATCCTLVLWFGSERMNAFEISISNTIKHIYDTVNVGILVFDPEKKSVLANGQARKLLDLRGEKGHLLENLLKISKEKADAHFEELVTKGESEFRAWTQSGKHICSAKTTVARDDYGEIYCYIMALYDMTKEESIMEELALASEAKSNFLANMSHEIRTPINAVLGMDEMILRECKEKDILRYARNIQSSGKTLLSLINDILDFSKIESGKMDILPQNYQLASVINDCYNMIQMRAKDKGLTLIVENDDTLPSRLYGDEVRIRQVYTNILTNAVKYTQEGSITIAISYEKLQENRINLIFSVKDTGGGIKKENIPRLFDSFERMDVRKNRYIEGTGLGLAITKEIVERMEGSIIVESEYRKGSTFTIQIPQVIVDMAPIGNIYELYVKSSVEEYQYKELFRAPDLNILAVDDVDINLVVLKGLLKQTRVKVDTAVSARQALKMIHDKSYDIIFMDHMMPEMDGIEALQEIRRDKTHKCQNVPVIALTANAVVGVEGQYRSYGFADYLSKPIQSQSLEKMIMHYAPEEKIMPMDVDVSMMDERNVTENKEDVISAITFLDTEMGIDYCLGDEEFYVEVLRTYLNEENSAEIEEMFSNELWENYQIAVHALKSTSLNIGEKNLSEMAKKLEQAIKAQDFEYVKAHHKEVLARYRLLLKELTKVLKEGEE